MAFKAYRPVPGGVPSPGAAGGAVLFYFATLILLQHTIRDQLIKVHYAAKADSFCLRQLTYIYIYHIMATNERFLLFL